MTEIWTVAAIWVALAFLSTFFSVWLGISTALMEILIGIIFQTSIVAFFPAASLRESDSWVIFLANCGAVVLTFLAGAELDPAVFKKNFKEVTLLGLSAFFIPFFGCTAVAYYILQWNPMQSWLVGIALSTTSVAVVYAVLLELGLNRTQYGKILLGACFVNDLVTVIILGLIFTPFTIKTVIFILVSLIIFALLPLLTKYFFKNFGDRPNELETKYLLMILFGFGALATWADSEAVLTAYIAGMLLANSVGHNLGLMRRIRTLTFGLFTPFFFIRTGSLVSVTAVLFAPITLIILFIAQFISKFVGVFPSTKLLKYQRLESMYTSLIMSTGLSFGTIAALFGLNHGIINVEQYSLIVAVVILSAIIPTMIANAYYFPKHLVEEADRVPFVELPGKKQIENNVK